jgi:beta-apo-4'-carotenal oxygenase
MPELPPFEHTPIDDIATTCATVRTTFLSHKTRPVEFRIQQLRKLYWAFKDNEALITEACKRDLGKSTFETYLVEISWCMNDCIWMANNLPRFAKDEKPSDISFTNRFVGPRIRKDPLGTALIIGCVAVDVNVNVDVDVNVDVVEGRIASVY